MKTNTKNNFYFNQQAQNQDFFAQSVAGPYDPSHAAKPASESNPFAELAKRQSAWLPKKSTKETTD